MAHRTAARIGIMAAGLASAWAAAAGSCGAVRAADFSVANPYYEQTASPAVYDWTGFYAGVNGGYGAGSVGSAHIGGAAGGAQAGYNLQAGGFVVGLEADLAAAGMDRSRAPDRSIDILGSGRVRAGVTLDPFLLYGTGGFSFANLSDGASGGDRWNSGWVVGVGAEVALSRSWTARLEAFRYDLGRVETGLAGPGAGVRTITVRGGVNYRF